MLTAAFGLCRIGVAGTANVQGEDQKKLDILSNDIMINSLRASGKCAVLVSEENEDPIIIDAGHRGRYCVVFDPLDGSSNIDAGVNIGTIFGVYKCVRSHSPCRARLKFPRPAADVPGCLTRADLFGYAQADDSEGSVKDVLRPGSELQVAGYCMYGSSANLVISTGQGVNGYTLDNVSLSRRSTSSYEDPMRLPQSRFSLWTPKLTSRLYRVSASSSSRTRTSRSRPAARSTRSTRATLSSSSACDPLCLPDGCVRRSGRIAWLIPRFSTPLQRTGRQVPRVDQVPVQWQAVQRSVSLRDAADASERANS